RMQLKGILPGVPPKGNRIEAIACVYRAYKDRNRVERMFNKLKQFRRIATRYDKTAVSFLGFLALAAAKLWMPTYVNRALVQQPGMHQGGIDRRPRRVGHRNQRQAKFTAAESEAMGRMLDAGGARFEEQRPMQRGQPVLVSKGPVVVALERRRLEFGA